MAKKYLLVLVLAASVAAGASAQSLWSIGGGLIFDAGGLGSGNGSGGGDGNVEVSSIPDDDWWGWNGPNIHGLSRSSSSDANLRQIGFGAWAFVDATFAELSIAIMRGSQIMRESGDSESGTILDVTLLGKLPFYFGWGDIFPLLGVGYQRWLGVDSLDYGLDISSTWRIMFGAGGDIDLFGSVFTRVSILGYYRFPQSWMNTGGWGVTIKAGIGFRL